MAGSAASERDGRAQLARGSRTSTAGLLSAAASESLSPTWRAALSKGTYHYWARLRSKAHLQLLRACGYPGSNHVHLGPGVRLINPSGITLGDEVNLAREVKLECLGLEGRPEIGNIVIGDRVFIGERTSIVSYHRITVGRWTMISHGCSIIDSNHGTVRGTLMRDQPGDPAAVVIGEDCWLGTGAIVLPGVTIGNGTIVGAGAVVTKSLPENVLAAGVPARVLRPR